MTTPSRPKFASHGDKEKDHQWYNCDVEVKWLAGIDVFKNLFVSSSLAASCRAAILYQVFLASKLLITWMDFLKTK